MSERTAMSKLGGGGGTSFRTMAVERFRFQNGDLYFTRSFAETSESRRKRLAEAFARDHECVLLGRATEHDRR